MQNSLIFWYWQLYQRFPEPEAVLLIAKNAVHQFLVSLSKKFSGQNCNFLSFRCEWVNKKFYNSAILFFNTEFTGVLQNGLKGKSGNILIFIPNSQINLFLQMQLNKLQLEILKQSGKYLTNPYFSDLDFVFQKNSFDDVDHLSFEGSAHVNC